MAGKRSFGAVRRLPSGRWQVRYRGPDGQPHTGRDDAGKPLTFDTEGYANAWLARTHADIQRGVWKPPAEIRHAVADLPADAPLFLSDYAPAWLETRRTARGQPLSPATRKLYGQTLAKQILPVLGAVPLPSISPAVVRDWYAGLETGPRQQAAAYSLLSTILATAVADEILTANPCRIRGAGQSERARDIRPATVEELAAIAAAMPAAYRLIVLLAGWTGLRFGELAELRRADVDIRAGVVHVRRGVVRGDRGRSVKSPKSRAGVRDVHIPPHLTQTVKDHLRDHVEAAQDALLFPGVHGGHLAPATLYGMYYPAREKAARPDLNFHDLRHTQAVLAAATGATLAELMARLGHSTASMALRYQHAAADRDKAIAEALSKLATVTPITAAKKNRRKEASS